MDLHQLPKITLRKSKRLGRGIGSGKGGHTSSRGSKGQKARGKVAVQFEGTKLKKSFIKRLPLQRGKGKFKPWSVRPVVVTLKKLEVWPAKLDVTLENLIKAGIVDKSVKAVKVIGNDKLKVALTVRVAVSKGAVKSIEGAGGKIVE